MSNKSNFLNCKLNKSKNSSNSSDFVNFDDFVKIPLNFVIKTTQKDEFLLLLEIKGLIKRIDFLVLLLFGFDKKLKLISEIDCDGFINNRMNNENILNNINTTTNYNAINNTTNNNNNTNTKTNYNTNKNNYKTITNLLI